MSRNDHADEAGIGSFEAHEPAGSRLISYQIDSLIVTGGD